MTTVGIRKERLLAILLLAPMASACSHALAIKNLDVYATPVRMSSSDHTPKVAVLPFKGQHDSLFYFNSIVQSLSADPGIGELTTDYVARRNAPPSSRPDLILSISPHVEYRSSGWNFLINWPGFVIFTPAWNGYVYHADVVTDVAIHDGQGQLLTEATVPVSYSIRHAEMDRTIFTGLTWLEVSGLAFVGGIYNAFVFDRDLIGDLQVQAKDNYATFVTNQIRPKIRSAMEAVADAREPSAERLEIGRQRDGQKQLSR